MLKLHLGCGKRNFGPDWVHIDGETKYPHVKYHDIVNLPFKDNKVDLIYACHVLEYFDREEGMKVLKKWYKALKVDGILRISVPNLSVLCFLYHNNEVFLKDILGPLFGKMEMNRKWIYHKTAYDYFELKHILFEIGFYPVDVYDWRQTEHAHIDDFSQAYIPHMDKENGTLISLNVKAIKS